MRTETLDLLLRAERPLNHHELEKTLRERGFPCDKVTLYRVLDWLVNRGLAHKISGEDRVWRYEASRQGGHTHFQCTYCGRVFCMETPEPTFAFDLPPGFRYDHAELKLQGRCPDCPN